MLTFKTEVSEQIQISICVFELAMVVFLVEKTGIKCWYFRFFIVNKNSISSYY